MRISQYSKELVMVAAAGAAVFVASNSDGIVSPVEYVNIVIAILGAIVTFLLPNLETGIRKYAQFGVSFATAAATALAVIVAHSADWAGVSGNDWISVCLAGLAAVGLYIIPKGAAVAPVALSATDKDLLQSVASNTTPAITINSVGDPQQVADDILKKFDSQPKGGTSTDTTLQGE